MKRKTKKKTNHQHLHRTLFGYPCRQNRKRKKKKWKIMISFCEEFGDKNGLNNTRQKSGPTHSLYFITFNQLHENVTSIFRCFRLRSSSSTFNRCFRVIIVMNWCNHSPKFLICLLPLFFFVLRLIHILGFVSEEDWQNDKGKNQQNDQGNTRLITVIFSSLYCVACKWQRITYSMTEWRFPK